MGAQGCVNETGKMYSLKAKGSLRDVTSEIYQNSKWYDWSRITTSLIGLIGCTRPVQSDELF